MTSIRLLPIVVLAIGGRAGLSCGNQQQVPSDLKLATSQNSKNIGPVNASDVAAAPGSHVTQFTLSNPQTRDAFGSISPLIR
jgi:hypothetical protein